MHVVRRLLLLTAMLIAVRAVVCADDTEVLRRKAETTAAKAAALGQKQNRKDLNAALSLFQESIRLFKTADLPSRAAAASLQLGEIYVTLSQYANAEKAFGETLELAADDREIACRALSQMTRTYASTGKPSEADTFSLRALNLSGQLSKKCQADALEARGETFFWVGDTPQATDALRQALDLYADLKDEEGQAVTLLVLAYTRFMAGETTTGIQLAERSLRLWSALQNSYGMARAQNELGTFVIMEGEFDAAECEYKAALSVLKNIGDKDTEGVVLNGIGYALWQQGDSERSLKNYHDAWAAFVTADDKLGIAESITGMARALISLGRYEQALPLYRKKLSLARQAEHKPLIASAMADLAGLYELQRLYRKAEALYGESLKEYRSARNPNGEGNILLRLAQLHIKQRHFQQALSFLQQALKVKNDIDQVEEVARIQFELAKTYRDLNRLEEARTWSEKTIEIIESQRLKITNFDSRADYFASVHKYYALYIQILMVMSHQFPNTEFLRQAFEASEKSKVRAFIDLLTASNRSSNCDALLKQQSTGENSTETAALDRKASAAPVSTLEDVQEEIGSDGSLLLEYSLGDEKSNVWVVDKDHIVAHELAPAEQIRKLVGAMRGALTARQQENDKSLDERKKRLDAADAAYYSYARQLSRLLLGPVDLSGAKRLLIVPDSSLQYIPFAALPLSDKKSETLANHYEVVMLPSASALSTLRKAAANRVAPTSVAAVFADPVFEHDDPRLSRAGQAQKTQGKPQFLKDVLRDAHQSQHLERLEGSRIEAENIRKAFKDQDVLVAEDFRATKGRVLQGTLEHYRYVHFATHGIIDARRPEMSGIILSLISEDGKNQDGYLRLGDIYKLKLSADLVVLSACQSALGKDVASEGIIGLPRAFLYAGAKSVIASLWKVDDEATAAFMKGFYARIQGGENPSSALRGAQIEMARSAKWAAPFYWATFVLQGDYK